MDTRYNPYPRELAVPLCRPPALAIDQALAFGDGSEHGSARGTLRALRDELGRQLGREPARLVPTTSGRAALSLALHALSLANLDASAGALQGRRRDEVIVPSFGCPQVIEAVLDVGLTPVLCDTAPDRAVPDLAAIEAVASERSLALVAASVLGERVELEAIEAWAEAAGVAVIDDAAQAFAGAPKSGRCPGTGGQLGVLSFGRHKPVCVGEGGALVVNAPALAPFVQAAREQLDIRWRRAAFARARADEPATPRPWFTDVADALAHPLPPPYAADMDGATAVRVFARLAETDEPELAARVAERLAARTPARLRPRPHDPALPRLYFAVEVPPSERHALAGSLAAAGVETSWLYLPLHHSPRYAGYTRAPLVHAEALWPKLLLLPCRGWLSPAQVERVAEALASLAQLEPASAEVQP